MMDLAYVMKPPISQKYRVRRASGLVSMWTLGEWYATGGHRSSSPYPSTWPFFLHFLFLGFLLETLFEFAGWKALAKPPAGPPGAQRGSSCGHLKQGCWGRIGQPGLRSVADRRRLRPADLSHRASWPHANGEAPAVP